MGCSAPSVQNGPVSESSVRCTLIRGGTSKGAYFVTGDLPTDPAARDDLLLRILGSPDPRQIDGIGPPPVRRAGIVRTARKLMDGTVFAGPPAAG